MPLLPSLRWLGCALCFVALLACDRSKRPADATESAVEDEEAEHPREEPSARGEDEPESPGEEDEPESPAEEDPGEATSAPEASLPARGEATAEADNDGAEASPATPPPEPAAAEPTSTVRRGRGGVSGQGCPCRRGLRCCDGVCKRSCS